MVISNMYLITEDNVLTLLFYMQYVLYIYINIEHLRYFYFLDELDEKFCCKHWKIRAQFVVFILF